MGSDENKKVSVNGTTSGYSPTTQDQITMALLQSGGVKRIQSGFQQRLDEAGWTRNLRDYVERLFRTGEATSYDDALKIVIKHVSLQPLTDEGDVVVNGSRDGGVPDLTISREAAKDAAEIVKRELQGVVQMDK